MGDTGGRGEKKASSELGWCSPGTSWFGLGNEDRSGKELAQTRTLTQTPAGSSVKTVRTLLENRHDHGPKITFKYRQEKQPAEALTKARRKLIHTWQTRKQEGTNTCASVHAHTQTHTCQHSLQADLLSHICTFS